MLCCGTRVEYNIRHTNNQTSVRLMSNCIVDICILKATDIYMNARYTLWKTIFKLVMVPNTFEKEAKINDDDARDDVGQGFNVGRFV